MFLISVLSFDPIFLELKKINEKQQTPIELDVYVKKLNNSRRRIMLVSNILQNVQVVISIVFYTYSQI